MGTDMTRKKIVSELASRSMKGLPKGIRDFELMPDSVLAESADWIRVCMNSRIGADSVGDEDGMTLAAMYLIIRCFRDVTEAKWKALTKQDREALVVFVGLKLVSMGLFKVA